MYHMIASNPFERLHHQQALAGERLQHLFALAQEWDKATRTGLQQLAQTLWPDVHLLGMIPRHRYRLRHQMTSAGYVWWVEHDIPPYDRYWCAAYRVQLTLDEQGVPVLKVQSGAGDEVVTPLTPEALAATLARGGEHLPLLIPRKMGRALDPE
jgi:hypothetical protein